MEIFSERLMLVPLSSKDIPDIHRMNCFEEVARYNTIGIPKNMEATAELLNDAINGDRSTLPYKLGWTIRTKSEQHFLGEMGMRLSSKKYNSAEIHYSLLPSEWGKGYASEAASALILWGFDHLKLHRITAGVATANERSIKLLEKIGMTKEGLCRQILPIRGEWVDNYQYAILASDLTA